MFKDIGKQFNPFEKPKDQAEEQRGMVLDLEKDFDEDDELEQTRKDRDDAFFGEDEPAGSDEDDDADDGAGEEQVNSGDLR